MRNERGQEGSKQRARINRAGAFRQGDGEGKRDAALAWQKLAKEVFSCLDGMGEGWV